MIRRLSALQFGQIKISINNLNSTLLNYYNCESIPEFTSIGYLIFRKAIFSVSKRI